MPRNVAFFITSNYPDFIEEIRLKIYILTLKFGNKFRHNSPFFGYRNSEATSCYGHEVVSLDERKQIGKVQD